jgi:hypothetical protein
VASSSERANDVVHYYKGTNGNWFWHRVAPNNEILSSGEGYENKDYCIEIATALNPDIEVIPEPEDSEVN